MTEALNEVPTVAKKKSSKSESRRYNTLVRLDDEMVEKAKVLVAMRKTTLGEFFSAILRPHVERELSKEYKKRAKEDEEPK